MGGIQEILKKFDLMADFWNKIDKKDKDTEWPTSKLHEFVKCANRAGVYLREVVLNERT